MIEPEISVLVPVYNSSEFLNQAIESILNQTFEDFEVILVNDGSTDNSLDILQDFAKNDNRLKIFNKENGGSGSARNMALREAIGKYVYFLDPDDYITPNLLELTHANAVSNESDMVIFKANGVDENDNLNEQMVFFYLDKEFELESYDDLVFDYTVVRDWVLNRSFAPWAKLYKKEFLDSYDDFVFGEGISFEDVPFHIKSMLRAKRISFVNEALYHWRYNNQESVSHTAKCTYDIFKIIDIVYDLLKSEGHYEEFAFDFEMFTINHSFIYITTNNSEDYFNSVKEKFEMMNVESVEKMPQFERDRYNLVMISNDLEEFKIKNEMHEYKRKIEILNNQIHNLRLHNNQLNTDLNMSHELNEKLTRNLEKVEVNLEKVEVNLEKVEVNLEKVEVNLEKTKNRNEKLKSDLQKAKKSNKKLKSDLKTTRDSNKKLKIKLDKSQKFNSEILSSKSWKITKPLRTIRNFKKDLSTES